MEESTAGVNIVCLNIVEFQELLQRAVTLSQQLQETLNSIETFQVEINLSNYNPNLFKV